MKQCALGRVTETLSTAYRTEWLTGETGQQNVEFWDVDSFNLRDITVRRLSEVPFVGALGMSVPLGAEDALSTGALERDPHAADSREEIYKCEALLVVSWTTSPGHT